MIDGGFRSELAVIFAVRSERLGARHRNTSPQRQSNRIFARLDPSLFTGLDQPPGRFHKLGNRVRSHDQGIYPRLLGSSPQVRIGVEREQHHAHTRQRALQHHGSRKTVHDRHPYVKDHKVGGEGPRISNRIPAVFYFTDKFQIYPRPSAGCKRQRASSGCCRLRRLSLRSFLATRPSDLGYPKIYLPEYGATMACQQAWIRIPGTACRREVSWALEPAG